MAQSVGAIALDIVMGKNTVSNVAKQAMTDVQKTFNDGSATVTDKTKAIGQAFTSVGASMAPMSLAAQGFVATSTNAAVEFETSMAQVKTIAGDTAVSYKGNMMDMSDAILKLSSDSGIAAEDIALATYGAISAGVDVSKSVEFVATANALAVGGFTEMSTSVDVLTTVMNAYGEKAGSAESISDKLITTQNLGKTTVDELASSMGKVIPTASAYNVSIDNLCASYVAMTKGGIATAEATTYTKSMLNELADSGSNVGKVLQDQTGKSFGQLMNEGYSLADVIDILGQSVDGDKEKFAQLWGSSEAGTGALAILNGGTQDFNNTLKEMQNSTGAASTAMNQMNDTSAHKMQVAMNDMKLAAIELGGAFAPVMSGIASVISTVARAFTSLPGPVQTVIAVILGVVAVASPVLIAIGGVISAIGSLTSVIGVIGGALSGFVGFMSATVIPAISGFFTFLAANPIVLIIGAIIAVGALLITHWEDVKRIAGAVWEGICDIVKGVVDFLVSFISAAWEGIKNITSVIWEGICAYFTFVWDTIKTIFSTVLEAIKTVITTYINAIKAVITTVFNAIKNFISAVFNAIKTVITTYVNAVKTVITTVFNAIKNVITTVVNAIKSVITNVFNGIKNTVSSIVNGIKNTVSTVFNNILSAIGSTVGKIASTVRNGFNNAFNFIKSIPKQALQWGKDMIMGIVNGIKSCINAVGDAVKSVADKIRAFLHFSVPDEGPLTDYETWMPDFIGGMANGIDRNKYKLIDAVKGMAGEMAMPAMSMVPAMNAPSLHNVGTNTASTNGGAGDGMIYELLNKLVEKVQNVGDITIPVYLGNDLLDEQIIKADDRRTVRSGGRA